MSGTALVMALVVACSGAPGSSACVVFNSEWLGNREECSGTIRTLRAKTPTGWRIIMADCKEAQPESKEQPE